MTVSPIQLAAEAALEAKRQALAAAEQAERDLLLSMVNGHLDAVGIDPELLTVVHVDQDEELVVVSDGTVPVAVRSDGRMSLVSGAGADWTQVAGPFTDLADLGAALEQA